MQAVYTDLQISFVTLVLKVPMADWMVKYFSPTTHSILALKAAAFSQKSRCVFQKLNTTYMQAVSGFEFAAEAFWIANGQLNSQISLHEQGWRDSECQWNKTDGWNWSGSSFYFTKQIDVWLLMEIVLVPRFHIEQTVSETKKRNCSL